MRTANLHHREEKKHQTPANRHENVNEMNQQWMLVQEMLHRSSRLVVSFLETNPSIHDDQHHHHLMKDRPEEDLRSQKQQHGDEEQRRRRKKRKVRMRPTMKTRD